MDSAVFAFVMHVVVITGAAFALRFGFSLSARTRNNLALVAGAGVVITLLHEVFFRAAGTPPDFGDLALRAAEVAVAFVLITLL